MSPNWDFTRRLVVSCSIWCMLHHAHYYAQEQYEDYYGKTKDHYDQKLGTTTNVAGIGSILWSLVVNDTYIWPCFDTFSHTINNLISETRGLFISGHGYTMKQLRDHFLTGRRFRPAQYYSEELKDFVRVCVQYNMSDRPTLEDLWDRIQSKYTADPSMRDRPNVPFNTGNMDQFSVGKNHKKRAG